MMSITEKKEAQVKKKEPGRLKKLLALIRWPRVKTPPSAQAKPPKVEKPKVIKPADPKLAIAEANALAKILGAETRKNLAEAQRIQAEAQTKTRLILAEAEKIEAQNALVQAEADKLKAQAELTRAVAIKTRLTAKAKAEETEATNKTLLTKYQLKKEKTEARSKARAEKQVARAKRKAEKQTMKDRRRLEREEVGAESAADWSDLLNPGIALLGSLIFFLLGLYLNNPWVATLCLWLIILSARWVSFTRSGRLARKGVYKMLLPKLTVLWLGIWLIIFLTPVDKTGEKNTQPTQIQKLAGSSGKVGVK
jgi:hypothetical protein